MKFYTYYQNNTGGRFKINDRVAKYVIVEAESPEKANEIATRIGIYFNGVEEDIDCPCCGDRWHPAYFGEDEPLVYGKPVDSSIDCDLLVKGDPIVHVYYANGKKKTIWK